jgi:redox-sensitive bicupin YhaK (pirin superfamily)
VHFLQIWLLPSQRGIAPGYEQKTFPREQREGSLQLVASPDGADGSLTIHSDARLYLGSFGAEQRHTLSLAPDRHAWVQVARGSVRVLGHDLREGDGAGISEHAQLEIEGLADGEVLVFDLA